MSNASQQPVIPKFSNPFKKSLIQNTKSTNDTNTQIPLQANPLIQNDSSLKDPNFPESPDNFKSKIFEDDVDSSVNIFETPPKKYSFIKSSSTAPNEVSSNSLSNEKIPTPELVQPVYPQTAVTVVPKTNRLSRKNFSPPPLQLFKSVKQVIIKEEPSSSQMSQNIYENQPNINKSSELSNILDKIPSSVIVDNFESLDSAEVNDNKLIIPPPILNFAPTTNINEDYFLTYKEKSDVDGVLYENTLNQASESANSIETTALEDTIIQSSGNDDFPSPPKVDKNSEGIQSENVVNQALENVNNNNFPSPKEVNNGKEIPSENAVNQATEKVNNDSALLTPPQKNITSAFKTPTNAAIPSVLFPQSNTKAVKKNTKKNRIPVPQITPIVSMNKQATDEPESTIRVFNPSPTPIIENITQTTSTPAGTSKKHRPKIDFKSTIYKPQSPNITTNKTILSTGLYGQYIVYQRKDSNSHPISAIISHSYIGNILKKRTEEVLSFPGPITSSTDKKKISEYLDKQISKEIHPYLKLLYISLRYLLDTNGYIDLLNQPPLPIISYLKQLTSLNLNISTASTPSCELEIQNVVTLSQEDQKALIVKVEAMLYEGKKREALDLCLANKLWSHAFIIGYSTGEKGFSNIAQKFVEKELGQHKLLSNLYSQYIGEISTTDFTTDSDWSNLLITILQSNSVNRNQQLVNLGDTIYNKFNNIYAAHTCYVLASLPLEQTNLSSKFVLIGANTKYLGDAGIQISNSDNIPEIIKEEFNKLLDRLHLNKKQINKIGMDINISKKSFFQSILGTVDNAINQIVEDTPSYSEPKPAVAFQNPNKNTLGSGVAAKPIAKPITNLYTPFNPNLSSSSTPASPSVIQSKINSDPVEENKENEEKPSWGILNMFKGIFKPSTVTQVDLSKHVSTDQPYFDKSLNKWVFPNDPGSASTNTLPLPPPIFNNNLPQTNSTQISQSGPPQIPGPQFGKLSSSNLYSANYK